MQFTLATLALVACARVVGAQGVTALLTPTASAPPGCATDFSGTFEITVVKPVAQRNAALIEKRCAASGTAVLSLSGSVLTDAQGRIGSIVANHQFQFDGPPAQAGAIYTGGWSVCSNGSLALGGSTTFFQCKSGNFYNLYDSDTTGALCEAILINILPCGTSGGVPQAPDGQPTAPSAATQATDGQPQVPSATPAVTQIPDGQVQASSAAPINQIPDGQVQATTAAPISQISDGQIQVPPTPAPIPVSQIPDGQVQATSAGAVPVSQISDGQVQATSAAEAPVSQIPDGQVQASSAAPINQISDGQIQATTAAPINQISDGQIQATTAAPIVQISDGQIQATTAAPIGQISDGQIQATTAAPTTLETAVAPSSQPSVGTIINTANGTAVAPSATSSSIFTGAAALATGSWMAAALGMAAMIAL